MHKPLEILRDREADTAAFRAASHVLCTKLMQELGTLLRERGVDSKRVVFVIILRSAIALLEPALRTFPHALAGVLGLKRDERTLIPRWYYENLPPLSEDSVVVVIDPMLATGGSAAAAVSRLIERGANSKGIFFLGVIAAREGVSVLSRLIPRGNIVCAAVDETLDAKGMIVPGLGDFGDRYFGYGDVSVSFGE